MTFISVVVPFYNAEKYIEDCIESLISQDFPADNYELIFIDNNSTDSSVDIVKRYPLVTLISENKQSPYVARNSGAKQATGSIIAFTDPDCIAFPDWLTEIEKAMSDPAVSVVLGQNLMGNDSPLLSMIQDYENEKEIYTFNSSDGRIYSAHTNNMAVRRVLFEELGPFVNRDRGADVIFVNSVVNKYSPAAVVYRATMKVRHMEIETPLDYYKKVFIYGISLNRFEQPANFRSISFSQRLSVYKNAIKKKEYSYLKSLALLVLLFVGALFWQAGAVSARFRSL